MFLTWIYLGIVLLFCVVLAKEIVDERKFVNQLTAVLVLVPMLLRLLMIK